MIDVSGAPTGGEKSSTLATFESSDSGKDDATAGAIVEVLTMSGILDGMMRLILNGWKIRKKMVLLMGRDVEGLEWLLL